jgi:hypothetical protein
VGIQQARRLDHRWLVVLCGTHAHTHTHTHTHAWTTARIGTDKQTYRHTDIQAYIYIHRHTHTSKATWSRFGQVE